MRSIMSKIVEIRPDLYELAKKSKKDSGSTYNIEGTTVKVNHWIQNYMKKLL